MIRPLIDIEVDLPHQICFDEALYLVQQYEVAQLALDRFMIGAITFQDYLDILEVCDVDMDAYLINADNNAKQWLS